MDTKIIAMGGGGFMMEPDNPLLDQYFLQQTVKARPRICYVPTAAGDPEEALSRFAVLFEDGRIAEVVASKPHARAYSVLVVSGAVLEEPLAARYLGGKASSAVPLG